MNFMKVTSYLESLSAEFDIPACDCIVHYHNKQVYRKQCGYSDAERTLPISGKDLYWMYSATKLVTCTAAMRLVEQGLMKLDDPVSKYFPEYASLTVKDESGIHPANTIMRIRDLFTMQGGLSYDLDTPAIRKVREMAAGHGSTREFVRAFAESPLLFEPSEEFFYSLCHDVLAAVIEVITGKRFSEYLEESIFAPLGMTSCGFGLSEEKEKYLSQQYTYDAEKNRCIPIDGANIFYLSPEYESGGSGLLCSAEDYILFASALSCDGIAPNGYQVLSKASIDLMRQNTLSQKQTEYFAEWAKRLRPCPILLDAMRRQGKVGADDQVAYRYGLGVRTLVNVSDGNRPVGEYGWDGAAGSYALVDTDNHIAIFYAQHVLSCTPASEIVQMKLRDMIYEAMSIELQLTGP